MLTPEFIADLHEKQGFSYNEIANKYQTTYEAVRSKYRRHKRQNKFIKVDPLPKTVSTVLAPPPKSKLPDDSEQWQTGLANLPSTFRFAFITDLHVPDHDPRAVDIAQQIVYDFKPHVIQHGSDAFDFETISRWDVDPEKVIDDAFEIVSVPYYQVMRGFRDAAPGALTPFLVGNHDERIWKFLADKAPQLRTTVTKVFIDMIRSAGGMWLGFQNIQYNLGHLKVIHGRSVTKYAAATHLDMFGVDVIAGHVHRAMMFTKTNEQRTLQSITSGCLCNLKPSYSLWRQNWQHGIVLATIDTENRTSHLESIVFDGYRAYWGGKLYKG